MEQGDFEYINAHGKRVISHPDPSAKRRRTTFSESIEMDEQPNYLTLQLLRKPQIESFARRQLALYHQQITELNNCYPACSRKEGRTQISR